MDSRRGHALDRAIVSAVFDADHPFTTQAAFASGIPRHELREPSWRQIMRGVWLAPEIVIDSTVLRDAARLVLPVDAVLCGVSALTEYGVDARPADDLDVHVAFDRQVPRRRSGLVLRQVQFENDEVIVRGRWMVTTPLRTAFDCARWLPFTEGLVAVDAMAHAGLVAIPALLDMAAAKRRVRGVGQMREIALLADPLAESPMETRLRLVLVSNGLPRPVSQYEVWRSDGTFVARLDLAYPDRLVAVEYDGTFHFAQRRSDDRRRDALRALGWTVLVFSADDVYRAPVRTARLVEQALARGAA